MKTLRSASHALKSPAPHDVLKGKMQRRSAPDKKRDGPPPGDPEPAGSENGVYVITQVRNDRLFR